VRRPSLQHAPTADIRVRGERWRVCLKVSPFSLLHAPPPGKMDFEVY